MAEETIRTPYERVKKVCDDYHHISGVLISEDQPEWLQAYYLGAHNTQRELKDRVLFALKEEANDRWTRDITAEEETRTDHDRMIAVHETLCTLMQKVTGDRCRSDIKQVAALMNVYDLLSNDSLDTINALYAALINEPITPESILDDTADETPETAGGESKANCIRLYTGMEKVSATQQPVSMQYVNHLHGMIKCATTIAELNEIETGFSGVASTDEQKQSIGDHIQKSKNALRLASEKLFMEYKNRMENAESHEQLNSIKCDMRTANGRDSIPRLTDEHFSSLMGKAVFIYGKIKEKDRYTEFANDIKHAKSKERLDYLYKRLCEGESFKDSEYNKLVTLIVCRGKELEGVDSGANTAE